MTSGASNGSSRPRYGERTKATARTDQEHAIRKEYGEAGELRGLVIAWGIAIDQQRAWGRDLERGELDYDVAATARDCCAIVADSIARLALARFPKRARIDLADAGASPDEVERWAAELGSERVAARSAKDAARDLVGKLEDCDMGGVPRAPR